MSLRIIVKPEQISKWIAERNGTPVIDNVSAEQATAAVMELVLSSAERLQAVP